MYRKDDLQYLQNIYKRNNNSCVVIYGHDTYCINEIVKALSKDSDALYVDIPPVLFCSINDIINNQIYSQTKTSVINSDNISGLELFLNIKSNNKKIININNFDVLLGIDNTYLNYIFSLISKYSNTPFMFILSTSNIKWIEQDMFKLIGKITYELDGIHKIEAFTIDDIKNLKSDYSLQNIFELYSCIGGNQFLWNNIDNSSTLKSYIIKHLLISTSSEYIYGNYILPADIRNASVYNTILLNLANGNNKLNNLYKATGIERAKLAVYLKKLIDYDFIFKEDNNITKAFYRIKDPFIHFWYKYIFPNTSLLRTITPERFYKRIIEPDLSQYLEDYYIEYCIQKSLNNTKYGLNVDKIIKYNSITKQIDFIIKTNDNRVGLCKVNTHIPHMNNKLLDDLKFYATNNKISYDFIILYSTCGYDQKITMTNVVDKSIMLIDEENHFIK